MKPLAMINNHVSFQFYINGLQKMVRRSVEHVIVEIIIFSLQWNTYVLHSLPNTIIDVIYLSLK